MKTNDENKQKLLNLFSTILITSRDDLNDFVGVTDKDRINAILCFVLDIAETLGISDEEVKRNIKSANPKRLKEIADYMDRAFGTIEALHEIEKED